MKRSGLKVTASTRRGGLVLTFRRGKPAPVGENVVASLSSAPILGRVRASGSLAGIDTV